jgi:hypothetical protein
MGTAYTPSSYRWGGPTILFLSEIGQVDHNNFKLLAVRQHTYFPKHAIK